MSSEEPEVKTPAQLADEADEAYACNKRKKAKLRLKRKLVKFLREFKNIIVVTVDHVGSSQMQVVRQSLRGDAEVLMGKNTVLRKVIREHAEENPKVAALLPYLVGNIGFVFTNENLAKVRATVVANKVPAAAKSGAISPVDVIVPAGPTGMDPGQTAFFQALNIGTKIARGSIEIITDVLFLKAGDKVTSSHVQLLSKLNMKPFSYGFVCNVVYDDGFIYDADVLDLTNDELKRRFSAGVRKIAAIGLEVGYPHAGTVGPSLRNAFKKLLAIVSEIEGFTFEQAKEFFGDSGDKKSGSDSDSGSSSGSSSSSSSSDSD